MIYGNARKHDSNLCMPDSAESVHPRSGVLLYFSGEGGEQNRARQSTSIDR